MKAQMLEVRPFAEKFQAFVAVEVLSIQRDFLGSHITQVSQASRVGDGKRDRRDFMDAFERFQRLVGNGLTFHL